MGGVKEMTERLGRAGALLGILRLGSRSNPCSTCHGTCFFLRGHDGVISSRKCMPGMDTRGGTRLKETWHNSDEKTTIGAAVIFKMLVGDNINGVTCTICLCDPPFCYQQDERQGCCFVVHHHTRSTRSTRGGISVVSCVGRVESGRVGLSRPPLCLQYLVYEAAAGQVAVVSCQLSCGSHDRRLSELVDRA